MINETIHELSNMRCEEEFNNIWNKLNILREMTIKKNYEMNIYYNVLDSIINDRHVRFEENDLNILSCMQDIILNNNPKQT